MEISTLTHRAPASDVSPAFSSDVWAAMPGVTFLNFAGHAAMPRAAVEAAKASAEAKAAPVRADFGQFFDPSERARALIAGLIGAAPTDIALNTGASSGMSTVAHALHWRPGDQILIGRDDFPAHHATFEPLARREGVELCFVGGDASVAADVLAAITPATRLVSLSHVNFQTGALLDAEQVGRECRRRDIPFLLDVSQSCGAMPFDIAELGADFAVGIGYKYLLGPWGVGFIYIAPHRLARLPPMPSSWLNQGVSDFSRLNLANPKLVEDARALDAAQMAGPYNINLCAFAVALEVVHALGPERVQAHTRALIDVLKDGLSGPLRFESPTSAANRGPTGAFSAETHAATVSLTHALYAERIIVSLRGSRIRVAPHLMNTEADIKRLLDVTRRWRATYRGQ
jgi:selenocysteine lyase/cysteine desulfurase